MGTTEETTPAGVDTKLLETIVQGHVAAQLKPLTEQNASLLAQVETLTGKLDAIAKPEPAKKKGEADAPTLDSASAEAIAKLTERLDAFEGEKATAASVAARRDVLAKIRPGLADRKRIADRIVREAKGDTEADILAAAEEVRLDLEEGGATVPEFAEDFAANGGKADKESGDEDDAAKKRWAERAESRVNPSNN